MRRWISVLVVLGLLAAAPVPNLAGAQGAAPQSAPRASTVDAIRTYSALASDKDALDEADLAELGPNPYLSFTIDRDPTEVVLWRALAASLQQRSGDLKAPSGPSVRYREQEPRGEVGANDIVRRGERVRGFGSGPGDRSHARITGSLVGFERPAVEVSGSSVEDDGAIGLANAVASSPGVFVRFAGEVGDGPNAATGDFDFYNLGAVAEGETIIVATDTTSVELPVDTFVAVFTAAGEIVDVNDDFGGTLDSYLEIVAPVDTTYYAMVTGCCGLPLDPNDPASGEGAGATGGYEVEMGVGVEGSAGGDADVFLIDLDAGDALVAGVAGSAAMVEIYGPSRKLVMGSSQNVSFIYPRNSPLRHQGFIGLEHITATSGRYAIRVTGGTGGAYEIALDIEPAGGRATSGTDTQVVFLDFDGATVDTRVFGGIADRARLSPLRDFLFRWGLGERQENAVIDATIASFRENIANDLARNGDNGDRDITGIGGQFDVVVRNSRDHPDPGRGRNVTRIVVGGTIPESGIPTIGIAQSIDPGNLDRGELALVLLDVLSGPEGQGGLNDVRLRRGASMVDLVGVTLGNVAAHEAGHLLGNWHTDTFNARPVIMDAGGDLANLVGIGPDGRFGTRDDVDVDFRTDEFIPEEGFLGREDTLNRTAFALSTGSTGVEPTCTITGTPSDDRLAGTGNNDVICGLGGNDVIVGNGGRDRLIGGDGDDVIRGGVDWDILLGDAGNDQLVGGDGADFLDGGVGDDVAAGGSGTDTCIAERRTSCERR